MASSSKQMETSPADAAGTEVQPPHIEMDHLAEFAYYRDISNAPNKETYIKAFKEGFDLARFEAFQPKPGVSYGPQAVIEERARAEGYDMGYADGLKKARIEAEEAVAAANRALADAKVITDQALKAIKESVTDANDADASMRGQFGDDRSETVPGNVDDGANDGQGANNGEGVNVDGRISLEVDPYAANVLPPVDQPDAAPGVPSVSVSSINKYKLTSTLDHSLIDLPLPSSTATKLPPPLTPSRVSTPTPTKATTAAPTTLITPAVSPASAAASTGAALTNPHITTMIPGTLYNIPPPWAVTPITPDFSHPLPRNTPHPPYPTFSHNNSHSSKRVTLCEENPHRVLIGPLSPCAQHEWRCDNGKGYLRRKVGTGSGERILFCEMVWDVKDTAYVVAMFETVAGAEKARGVFRGWACGGKRMWSWVWKEVEWEAGV